MFSPDGEWLAYTSNQSGTWETYVTPYPGPGPRHQISNGGRSRAPAWSPKGRELFYRTTPVRGGGPRTLRTLRTIMAVDIRTDPTFTCGPQKRRSRLAATEPRGKCS